MPLTVTAVVNRRAGQFLDLVLRRIRDGKLARRARGRAGEVRVELRRVGAVADFDRHVLQLLGFAFHLRGRRRLAGQLHQSAPARAREVREHRVAFRAGRSSTGTQRAARCCNCSSARSTAPTSRTAGGLRSVSPAYSPTEIGGIVSKSATNVSGRPSSRPHL
jgi:hypothetical protein